MQIIRELSVLRDAVREYRSEGKRIALVPTMGALHAGHLALVEEGLRRADVVVTSIFVNPRQFAPNEDLDRYPRRERADAQLLEKANATILWAPTIEEMYPDGFATNVSVSGVSEVLDGAARPGHFDGVATVVLKLFNQVKPDVALFGEKDWQQLAVVRRMATDLDLELDIVGVPTVRDDQGLALSSRNAYLTEDELAKARILPRSLGEAAAAIGKGEPVAGALTAAVARLSEAGFDPIDYVSLRDAETLAPIEALGERPARLLAAARMGNARLIDNLPVTVSVSPSK
ncbi:pantoate--beta-alanine ligase [Sphingomonas sp. CGMCC 1.13654]|uniref:Pantothenate synthetase n=1 Tax=Sphingomonas chungangi TaxID=2683589 RepID=A0A838L4C9_9SPHN|nr:pantoate--beta-alanine ligase [Sphingomonas chungangi]MVW57760.1 pantoate--beta-alanine ligase [Sphingomonas chungangi]